MQSLEVLAILNGGHNKFSVFKRGDPVLRGGGRKVSDLQFSNFVAPLPRN